MTDISNPISLCILLEAGNDDQSLFSNVLVNQGCDFPPGGGIPQRQAVFGQADTTARFSMAPGQPMQNSLTDTDSSWKGQAQSKPIQVFLSSSD